LVQRKGGEGRDFNRGEGKGGEGRGGIVIKYMFGSRKGNGGEGRDFNQKYVWFTRGGEGF
jgi:hypothetical protein